MTRMNVNLPLAEYQRILDYAQAVHRPVSHVVREYVLAGIQSSEAPETETKQPDVA